MITLSSPQVVQETALRWRKETQIAIVPTMGALHDGHLALVRRAKTLAKRVIVSIFVNPLQFGPNEDFDRYPRAFESDCALLEKAGVDLVFNPTVQDLYPSGFSTTIQMGKITERLCGKHRPGHFNGVATICLKLFEVSQADFALFGEKDFQQLRVIQTMTRDLNLPISIVAVPTVREPSGLALSSRNAYLSENEKFDARVLSEILTVSRKAVTSDATCKVSDVLSAANKLLSHTSLKAQYVEVTIGTELESAPETALVNALPMPHLFLAIYAGTTRLIDNVSLNGIHT